MNLDEPAKNIFAIEDDQVTIELQSSYGDVMARLVNLGTYMLEFIRQDTMSDSEKKSIVFALFRRIIEMLDAASVQIDAGCIIPSVSHLRTLLEAFLQLEYLLLDSNLVSIKCKHYMIMELDGDIDLYGNIIDDSRKWPGKNKLDMVIKELQGKIDLPYFDEIRIDYKKKVFKLNGERKAVLVKWYSFTSNANSVKYLAQILLKTHYYTMVYSVASNVTHASRLLLDGYHVQNDQLLIKKIRDAEFVVDVAKVFIRLSIEASKIVGKHLLYNERFQYLQAMDEFHRKYQKMF